MSAGRASCEACGENNPVSTPSRPSPWSSSPNSEAAQRLSSLVADTEAGLAQELAGAVIASSVCGDPRGLSIDPESFGFGVAIRDVSSGLKPLFSLPPRKLPQAKGKPKGFAWVSVNEARDTEVPVRGAAPRPELPMSTQVHMPDFAPQQYPARRIALFPSCTG